MSVANNLTNFQFWSPYRQLAAGPALDLRKIPKDSPVKLWLSTPNSGKCQSFLSDLSSQRVYGFLPSWLHKYSFLRLTRTRKLCYYITLNCPKWPILAAALQPKEPLYRKTASILVSSSGWIDPKGCGRDFTSRPTVTHQSASTRVWKSVGLTGCHSGKFSDWLSPGKKGSVQSPHFQHQAPPPLACQDDFGILVGLSTPVLPLQNPTTFFGNNTLAADDIAARTTYATSLTGLPFNARFRRR